MKVLLMTRNHVVREFVELVADRVGADLEVVTGADAISGNAYTFVVVDDRGTLLEEGRAVVEGLECTSVVLYNVAKEAHEIFDYQVKKPFLPSEIQAILEAQEETTDAVLNLQDIEEIRRLLEGEGMEIVSEETLAEAVITEETLSSKETSAEEDTKSERTTEEKILEALVQMEPKRIRKLLKGAEVTLTIRFPKEER